MLTTSAIMGLRYILADWPIVWRTYCFWNRRRLDRALVRTRRAGEPPIGWRVPASGAVLTYAWHSFPEKPVLGAGGTIDLVGNGIFSIAAVVLIVAAGRAVRRGLSDSSAATESEVPVAV